MAIRTPSLLFSYTAPTQRTDGSEIPQTEQDKIFYRLYDGDTGDLLVDNIGALKLEYLMANKPHGTYKFTFRSVLYGLESPDSQVISVPFVPPMAPMNILVSWTESTV